MSNFNPQPKPKFKKDKRDRGNPKQTRLDVIEADFEKCLLCNVTYNLELHRIIYGAQLGKYELDNCVLLCTEHHAEIHANKRKWMPILQQHVEERGGEDEDM